MGLQWSSVNILHCLQILLSVFFLAGNHTLHRCILLLLVLRCQFCGSDVQVLACQMVNTYPVFSGESVPILCQVHEALTTAVDTLNSCRFQLFLFWLQAAGVCDFYDGCSSSRHVGLRTW